MFGYIYMIINKINGKTYIGQRKFDISEKLKGNKNGLRKTNKIKGDIKDDVGNY